MAWRAAGAQFYPGGAFEQLLEISRGRGPHELQFSDALLEEVVCDMLATDPLIDARNIDVYVERGEVTLQGTVEEPQQKYAIEDLVAGVNGVTGIHNALVVNDGGIEDQTND